jgi:hypothetical protein
MSNKQTIESITKNVDRLNTKGVYSNFQTIGSSLKQEKQYSLEEPVYSKEQDRLYNRALYGLRVYSSEEVQNMHWEKRERIKKVQHRTTKELNVLKQNRIISMSNFIFKMFHHSSFATQIVEDFSETIEDLNIELTLKQLNINKQQIVEHLYSVRLLPRNFYSLNENC